MTNPHDLGSSASRSRRGPHRIPRFGGWSGAVVACLLCGACGEHEHDLGSIDGQDSGAPAESAEGEISDRLQAAPGSEATAETPEEARTAGEPIKVIGAFAECEAISDLVVPVQNQGADGSPLPLALRWDTDSCVPIQLTASAAEQAAEAQSAINAFNNVACSRLCFTSAFDKFVPEEELGTPTAVTMPRRVLIAQAPPEYERDYDGPLVTIHYVVSSGELLAASIEVPTDITPERTLLSAFALAAGFRSPTDLNAPSVTHKLDSPGASATLTAADETSLCTLYGKDDPCDEEPQ